MNLHKLFNIDILQNNLEKDYWWIPLVEAGISALGSMFSSGQSASAQDRANQMNLQMTRETNAANQLIAEKTNQSNRLINRQNNEFNRQLAIDMFNMENQYNAPIRQMERLKAAGINPFVAAGNVGQVEGRVDTVPAQSPIPAQMIPNQIGPAVQPTYKDVGFTQGIASIASAFAQVASAGKQDAETKAIKTQLAATLDNIEADTNYKESMTHLNNINTYIQQMYGITSKKKELELLDKKISELSKEMLLMDEQINESKTRQDLNNIEYLLKDVEHGIRHKDYQGWDELRQYIIKEYIASINAHNKAADASGAQAGLYKSQSGYYNEQTRGLRLENDFYEDTREDARQILHHTRWMNDKEEVKYYERHDAELHAFLQQCEREGYITKEQKANAESAMKHADYAPVRELLGTISTAGDIGTKAKKMIR